MREVSSEVDRYLTLLRNKIRERGFTQLEVQETLGWGRSYISQLLTKQKTLRVEQVLLILQVIGADPTDFFRELYGPPARVPYGRPLREAPPLIEPAPSHTTDLDDLKALLHGLIRVLVVRDLVTAGEVREAAQAAEAEGTASPCELVAET